MTWLKHFVDIEKRNLFEKRNEKKKFLATQDVYNNYDEET